MTAGLTCDSLRDRAEPNPALFEVRNAAHRAEWTVFATICLWRWARVGDVRRRFFPRVDNSYACFFEVVSISGNKCKAVVERGCGNKQIGCE
jgi:hypothetical protein